MPSYTRPGVAAAARLAAFKGSNRVDIWERIEAKYGDMIAEKGGDKLVALDKYCDELSTTISSSNDDPSISKEDLLKVIDWKFTKGKPRYALMNRLKSNQNVEERSREAFVESKKGNVDEAINALCRLNGVGPATASAILTLHRGDIFAFMDDEVVEAVYDGKRGYTLKIYLAVNSKCTELAKALGENWTPRRVGRALWTAARMCASGEEDLNVQESEEPQKKSLAIKKVAGKVRAAANSERDTESTSTSTRGLRKRRKM